MTETRPELNVLGRPLTLEDVKRTEQIYRAAEKRKPKSPAQQAMLDFVLAKKFLFRLFGLTVTFSMGQTDAVQLACATEIFRDYLSRKNRLAKLVELSLVFFKKVAQQNPHCDDVEARAKYLFKHFVREQLARDCEMDVTPAEAAFLAPVLDNPLLHQEWAQGPHKLLTDFANQRDDINALDLYINFTPSDNTPKFWQLVSVRLITSFMATVASPTPTFLRDITFHFHREVLLQQVREHIGIPKNLARTLCAHLHSKEGVRDEVLREKINFSELDRVFAVWKIEAELIAYERDLNRRLPLQIPENIRLGTMVVIAAIVLGSGGINFQTIIAMLALEALFLGVFSKLEKYQLNKFEQLLENESDNSPILNEQAVLLGFDDNEEIQVFRRRDREAVIAALKQRQSIPLAKLTPGGADAQAPQPPAHAIPPKLNKRFQQVGSAENKEPEVTEVKESDTLPDVIVFENGVVFRKNVSKRVTPIREDSHTHFAYIRRNTLFHSMTLGKAKLKAKAAQQEIERFAGIIAEGTALSPDDRGHNGIKPITESHPLVFLPIPEGPLDSDLEVDQKVKAIADQKAVHREGFNFEPATAYAKQRGRYEPRVFARNLRGVRAERDGKLLEHPERFILQEFSRYGVGVHRKPR